MAFYVVFFMFHSVLHYYTERNGRYHPYPFFLAVISIVISASFVGIIVFNFALSLFEALSGFSLVIVALTIIYYIVFTIIIYKALMGK